MTGINRGRYDVILGGPWLLYTYQLPNWEMLGTVQRRADVGALGLSPEGIYAQINAGVMRMLDSRKIAASL